MLAAYRMVRLKTVAAAGTLLRRRTRYVSGMITLAVLSFSLAAHAVAIRYTFRPEHAVAVPVQTFTAQEHPADRGRANRDFLIRLVVRALAGHAPISGAPGAGLLERDAQLKLLPNGPLIDKTRP